MMRVLVDYHHAGLFNSFKLLGQRLGFEVFRPYGREWYRCGFWGVGEPYNFDDGVINQYLGPEHSENDDLIQTLPDLGHPSTDLCIGFNRFVSMPFDVIICSIQQHVERFIKLRDTFMPKAKLIWQQGNPGVYIPPTDSYPNLMDSVGQIQPWMNENSNYNYILYHQPFELDIFRVPVHPPEKRVSSFVLSMERKQLWDDVKLLSTGVEFSSFGYKIHGADHDPISGIQNIAAKMQKCIAGWHVKSIDGFGHIMHNWAACGVPIITSFKDYQGKIASKLLDDEVTAWNLDKHNAYDTARFISKLALEKDFFLDISDNVIRKFDEVVDFDAEAEQLENFFNNLR